jgi:delta14-sterol reductase
MSTLNPKTPHYQWGGPFGASGIILLLPTLVLALNSLCDGDGCSIFNAHHIPALLQHHLFAMRNTLLPTLAAEVAWVLFHLFFSLVPLGKKVQGGQLRDGKRLSYQMNGLYAFVVTHIALVGAWYTGVITFEVVETHFLAMAVGAFVLSLIFSVALYLFSFRKPQPLLALGGNTGNPIYDFYIGRELNPRWFFGVDLKFVMELRPGLIGWSFLNWGFVFRSLEIGTFTPSIFLVALFQSYYVFEAQWNEPAILTTMDIVHDGFGFMLCFGDIAWVPFLYCLQCKYLLYYPQTHETYYYVLIVALNALGYFIFRGSNSEKNAFRTDPKSPRVAHLKVMKTSAGKSLIISGFWGICRHPNYVGDWMMALAWSLLTGTTALIPYFYPIYFGILLIHRQLRDEESMLEKYGPEDWKKYCNHVPYRLIPYVY